MGSVRRKKKHCDGFLGCRTTKKIEESIKAICDASDKDVSEVMNYLCRIFVQDDNGVRTKFLKCPPKTGERAESKHPEGQRSGENFNSKSPGGENGK
ncbi:MAG: hypothetical protein WC732_01600 [Candidatus Omnitrophota bacterium]